MRSLRVATALDGTYITPREIMAELDEVSGVFNALDRDNFEASALGENKFAPGCWHVLQTVPLTNTETVVHEEGQQGSVYPIPDTDADDPWVLTQRTSDTVLYVSLFSCVESEEGADLWVGLRVNGLLFRTPWARGVIGHETHHLRCFVPVQEGTTLVEPVYGHKAAAGATPPWDLNWEHRRVTIRELVR